MLTAKTQQEAETHNKSIHKVGEERAGRKLPVTDKAQQRPVLGNGCQLQCGPSQATKLHGDGQRA